MNIGNNIKNRRIELGLSVDELARKINKNRATVYRYENNDIENLPTTILEPLAKALKTTPARLMGWSDDDFKHEMKTTIQEYRLCPSIAHAGTTDYNENEYYEPQYIKLPDELLGKYAGRKDIEFCKINGDSMNNIFLGHTIIGYLTDSNYYTLKAGDIVIFRYGTDLGVKRYYDIGDEIMFKADSHHPDFQDKEYRYPKDEYLQIIGKVVVYNVIM